MSSISVNTITDASGGSTTSINGFTPSVSNMAGRNRIINGDMRIDQRNAGASVTIPATTVTYTTDRFAAYGSQASKFSVQQNAGSITPPAGFANYLGVTSLSAYTVGSGDVFWIRQPIEGYNIADFSWGTANAKTVTLSFWVRSSLTGTFGGSVLDNFTPYSYPFSYTISSANTWEQKTITIVGPTSGTFPTGNTAGLYLIFSLGVGSTWSGAAGSYVGVTGATSVVGTSGATFYITGVQLEEGSVATPFEHRQYGQELALCQRYYETGDTMRSSVLNSTSSGCALSQMFQVKKRAAPTVTVTGTNALITASGVAILGNNFDSTASFYHGPSNTISNTHCRYAFGWTASAEV